MKTARQMGKEAFVVIRRDRNLVGSLYSHLLENGYEGQLLEPEEALAAAATVLSALRACSAGLRTSTAAGRQGPLPGLRNNET